MRARKASDEKTVRTPFQKFHRPSYSTRTCASAAGPRGMESERQEEGQNGAEEAEGEHPVAHRRVDRLQADSTPGFVVGEERFFSLVPGPMGPLEPVLSSLSAVPSWPRPGSSANLPPVGRDPAPSTRSSSSCCKPFRGNFLLARYSHLRCSDTLPSPAS